MQYKAHAAYQNLIYIVIEDASLSWWQKLILIHDNFFFFYEIHDNFIEPWIFYHYA